MAKSVSKITFSSRNRSDGTWYVEVNRPGIVTEHIGDFGSKREAEDWIARNLAIYHREHASDDRKAV